MIVDEYKQMLILEQAEYTTERCVPFVVFKRHR